MAQIQLPGATPPSAPEAKVPAKLPEGQGALRLLAVYGGEDKPVAKGLIWRVFQERAEVDGSHKLLRESKERSPLLVLPHGNYVVHVSWGLAGVAQRVEVKDKIQRAKLILNAGAVRITGMLGDNKIAADRLSASIYIPERRNPEAKLIARNIRPGQIVGLPEGLYHIVSTYLNTVKRGRTRETNSQRATNSLVHTDVRIRAGQLTDATLKHKAAVLTFKLVKSRGGEALANTNFTVLTPGGDVIREMIGAFPSLVLAEGEYTVIARNEGKTYQSTFKVESGADRDIEVLTQQIVR